MTLEHLLGYAEGCAALAEQKSDGTNDGIAYILPGALRALIAAAKAHEGEVKQLALAKDCFLNMIADADKWEVDVDGDIDSAGRSIAIVTYKLEVDGLAFEQLPEALGIKPRFMETMEEAIAREIDAPVVIRETEEPACE